ncbi:BTB/POZ domain-containing protein 9-like [Ciona intestinalis]
MSVSLCDPANDETNAETNEPSEHIIDHCDVLSQNIGALVMNPDFKDVTFVVNEKEFPAHRVILAARSSYFRGLLYGGMRESIPDSVIPIYDAGASAFEVLLRYIYTGKLKLSDIKESHVIEVLALANKFGFEELEKSISFHLRTSLSLSNACLIFDVALLYSLTELYTATAEFIDRNAQVLLCSDDFLNMSLDATCHILKRDSLCVPEKTIFKAVQMWCEVNQAAQLTDDNEEAVKKCRDTLLSVVRLPLISLPDLLNIVRPSSLISSDVLLDAIKAQTETGHRDLRFRGVLRIDENIATAQHGAQVVQGEMCASLLDGDSGNHDLDRGYTRHDINDEKNGPKERCIKVKLGQPSIINRIKLLLWDKDNRSYSYYVEVSMDDKDWTRLIDYSKFLCRSWQDLHFTQRVVRYIRVVGTHSSQNKLFHLVSLEAMFTSLEVNSVNGIVVPGGNVATVDKCACIIEGVSRDRNALINGDTEMYDWDSGYTCHQLGVGSIIIQLAQPYLLSSMRLLLWDIDHRCYSYYIEVSGDRENWTTIADKRKEEVRSWQVLQFDQVAATFIRIIGTANTANEVFHCVHFECPATVQLSESSGSVSGDSPPLDSDEILES